jgi:hypothetical protein
VTWSARSLVAFGVGLFAVTLSAEGLYHLIGTPGCRSTVTEPVRCSQESGWWALVLGAGVVASLISVGSARGGVVRRLLFGALLLGLGLGPVWAVVDGRTDSAGWAAAGGIGALLGLALLAGLVAAALRAAREPDTLARPPEPLGQAPPVTPPAPAQDAPAIRISGGDPFGRDPDEPADPFGRGQ